MKAPTSKKDPSEASYSNNRPKQSYTHVVTYKPSPSREGAGQMVYTTKTDPKGAKAGASFATSCIPYVGDAKDIQEAVTGKDLITGKKLTGGERAITITAAVLPVVSSPMLKGAAKGGKVAVKEAPDAVKKAGTFIKKNAPEVKNVAKNTDVAKDTAKAMKKKGVEKAKDVKKKETDKAEKVAKHVNEVSNSKTLNEWLKGEPDLLRECEKWYSNSPEWWGIDPEKTDVFYRTPSEVRQIRKKPGESGGHHPHGLALGGPEGQKLTPTGETAKIKNPKHSEVTGLQRRVINKIKNK